MKGNKAEDFLILLVIVVIVSDFHAASALLSQIGGAITAAILSIMLALYVGVRYLRNRCKATDDSST